jgi:hypothetical protein
VCSIPTLPAEKPEAAAMRNTSPRRSISFAPATRRKVLAGSGASLLLAELPSAAGALAPIPTLEELFGERRIAVLRAMFQANFGPLISDWRADTIFDDQGRFRASPAVRAGLLAFVRDHAPFQYVIDFDADQSFADMATVSMFGRANLLPPNRFSELCSFGRELAVWRHWTRDGGRAADWPRPSDQARSQGNNYWPQLSEPGRYDVLYVRPHPRRRARMDMEAAP